MRAVRWARSRIAWGDPDSYLDARPSATARPLEITMQTSNRLFDDFARLMTDAAGAAQGVRREAETLFKAQVERLIRDMDIASREEVDVLRDLVGTLRTQNEALAARITALEAKLGQDSTAGTSESV
jgi:BMFP domain-containing protein YqiC